MSTLTDFGSKHLFKGVGKSTQLVLEKGEGCWIYAAEEGATLTDAGKLQKYLDLTCGIGVTNLGHCHPKVTEAVTAQVAKLVHSQINIGYNHTQIKLTNALLPLMPHKSLDSFFYWNSGAEAVEAAVKLARHATKRQNIIAMQGSYHGRTFGTMALTKSKTIYSAGFLPAMPGVFTAPFPYATQMGYTADQNPTDEEMSALCLHQLELLLVQQSAPSDTAAIILEPVLGEGGYVPAPRAFLEGLRKICDREGILLIIDEVQSGNFRCGSFMAIEKIAPGLKPDVLITAKGIANGLPLSLIVTRKELSDKQAPGAMGGTYAGNCLSCASALAVVDVFKNGGIKENVEARSKEFFDALNKIKEDPKSNGIIRSVRGLGLMIGIEFNSPPHVGGLPLHASASDNNPSNRKQIDKVASRVQAKCMEKKMLTLTTSVYEVMRLIPPLIITKEEAAEAIRIITESIYEVAAEG